MEHPPNTTGDCAGHGTPISALALTMAMLPSIVCLGLFIVYVIRSQLSTAASGAEPLVTQYQLNSDAYDGDGELESDTDSVFLPPPLHSQNSRENTD